MNDKRSIFESMTNENLMNLLKQIVKDWSKINENKLKTKEDLEYLELYKK